MIDIEAIKQRNAERRAMHNYDDERERDACYEGYHGECIGAEDIDLLIAEVERLKARPCEWGALSCTCDEMVVKSS